MPHQPLLLLAPYDGLSQSELAQLLASLPHHRRQYCARFRRSDDVAASAAAFRLLMLGWAYYSTEPFPEVGVSATRKPLFVPENGWHFSLSHRDGWAGCVVDSAGAVGLDIHGRIPWDTELFEAIASPAEQELAGALERVDDVAPLWTRKEALGKVWGVFPRDLSALDTVLADTGMWVRTWRGESVPLTVSLAGEHNVASPRIVRVNLAKGSFSEFPLEDIGRW